MPEAPFSKQTHNTRTSCMSLLSRGVLRHRERTGFPRARLQVLVCSYDVKDNPPATSPARPSHNPNRDTRDQ